MSHTSFPGGGSDELPVFMHHVSDGALTALKCTQIGLMITMRSINLSLHGDSLRKHVVELFSTQHLFGKEIADMPRVWSALRSFLDQRGATLQSHLRRRIILAHCLYHEAEDQAAAKEMANATTASVFRVQQNEYNARG